VTSERLVIRPSVRADAPFLQRWWNDPAVMAPDGHADGMQYDDADIEQWFQRYVDCRACANHFVIALRQPSDQPIGEFYIACDDRPGCVDFVILIGEMAVWGQGYAREAIRAYAEALFAGKHCGAMRSNCRCDNQRAIHVLESIGFAVEHVWANGQFQTMVLTQAAYELKRLRAAEAAQAAV
jgi:RimJ/RimL family protein N-acetyltransferase